ncbi:MAG: ubiquinol-cytochrome C chaperone family protein [Alphaproteobacteria bacterium]
MAFRLFTSSRLGKDAERLLSTVTQISRQPNFFGPERVADTLEGRFELMTVNAVLALIRLRQEPALAPLGQEFTDQLFRHFDAGLREAAVGDLAVPRRMRKIAGAFYGRLDVYSKALVADDLPELAEALGRNALNVSSAAFAPVLAAYMSACAKQQAAAPTDALFRFDGWATAPG